MSRRNSKGGGNSHKGLGIHVPARVMGQFPIFYSSYGSCFVNLALVMGLICRDFLFFRVNACNLQPFLDIMTQNFRKKKFSFTNDTKHSRFTIIAGNFALFMGSYFKVLPPLWELIFKMLPWLWVLALNSQRHIFTRPL